MTLSHQQYARIRSMYHTGGYHPERIPDLQLEALAALLLDPENRDDARYIFGIDPTIVEQGQAAITKQLQTGLEQRIAHQQRLDRERGDVRNSRI